VRYPSHLAPLFSGRSSEETAPTDAQAPGRSH
jgi:hypothetical protein